MAQYMPIDKIKLDESINDKYLNEANKNIIRHIINLSHDLYLKIVAEGIEFNSQLEILQAMNPLSRSTIPCYDQGKQWRKCVK